MKGETYRASLDARKPGGDPCALVILRLPGPDGRPRVWLCHHGAIQTTAELAPADAIQVGEMLLAAARRPAADSGAS